MNTQIKLVKDTIDKEDIGALCTWLQRIPTPQLTKGPLTIEYEKRFAETIGVKYAVMVNSGSSALLLAVYLLKQKYGVKKIAIPAVSWVTDISPCIQFGIEPVLVDCNFQDLSVNLEDLEEVFRTEKPDAFILVSVLGLVPEMEKVVELCKKYNVLLIEDFCESQGSKYGSMALGAVGLMGCCSTYFGHITGTIEGGMITTDDTDIYYYLLMLRSHGWARDLPDQKQKSLRTVQDKTEFEDQYTFHMEGFNVRSTDLNAFLGLRQLDKLPSLVAARNINFKKYFAGIKHNMLNLRVDPDDTISNLGYPVVSEHREKIVKALQQNNIECRPLLSGNLARHPAFAHLADKRKLPFADRVHKFGFYLPNHPFLTDDEIQFIINIINENSL